MKHGQAQVRVQGDPEVVQTLLGQLRTTGFLGPAPTGREQRRLRTNEDGTARAYLAIKTDRPDSPLDRAWLLLARIEAICGRYRADEVADLIARPDITDEQLDAEWGEGLAAEARQILAALTAHQPTPLQKREVDR